MKLLMARFPFGRSEDPDVTDWYADTLIEANAHPAIDKVCRYRMDDTPITMGRNRTIHLAKSQKVDFLLMVDSDMSPDAYLESNPYHILPHPGAEPFFRSSLDFLLKCREAAKSGVIAAPYCGPPPHENIYVFHWETRASDVPADQGNWTLEQYSRWEADKQRGITRVAALPTGLILIDMQALEKLEPPYTYYEWSDVNEMQKDSTEDVTFTRDLSLLGVPLYCHWDAWAGHWKRKCVGRPHIITEEAVGDKYRQAVLREHNIGKGEELKQVKPPVSQEVQALGDDNGREAEPDPGPERPEAQPAGPAFVPRGRAYSDAELREIFSRLPGTPGKRAFRVR